MERSVGRPRLHHYDYLRGLCAVMIIAIHAVDPVLTTASLGSPTWWGAAAVTSVVRVGLPLFFMLSGALLLGGPAEPVGATYRKRLPRVIVPLFVYSAIYILVASRHDLGNPSVYLGIISAVISGPVFYHLWFVYALVGLYLALPFLKGMVRSLPDRDLAILCGVVVFYFALRCYLPAVGMTLGTSEFIFAGWAVYLILGLLVARHWEHPLMRWMPVVGVAGLVATIAIMRWLPLLSTELFAFSPTMVAMAASLWWCAERARNIFHGDRWVYPVIAGIARHSYGIYLIHALVLSTVLYDGFGLSAIAFHPAGALPTTILLTLIVSWGLALVVDRAVSDRLTRRVGSVRWRLGSQVRPR